MQFVNDRKLRFTLFILFLAGVFPLAAQIALGEWRTHLSYKEVTYASPAGNKVYVLSSGALFSYDIEDQSVVTYDKVTVLNDQNISYIQYSKEAKALIIVYANYNIDLLYDTGECYNLPSYMNKVMAQDKTINSVVSLGGSAYLCTNFGIVAVDLRNAQISNTYIIDRKIYSCTLKGNAIYGVSDGGLIKGDLSDNLLEAANWKVLNTTVYRNVLLYSNRLYLTRSNGLYVWNESTQTTTRIQTGNYSISNVSDGKLIVSDGSTVLIYTSADTYYSHETGLNFSYICSANNVFWGCLGVNGLTTYRLDTSQGKLVAIESIRVPDGPIRNLASYMRVDHNRLLVCGGGMYTNRFGNKGTILQYKNGEWTSFQEAGIAEQTGVPYLDISTIAVDPADSSHCFASSIGEGIYEFRGGQFVAHYSENNSGLQSIYPNQGNANRYVRTSGLNYDSYGNLWAMNMKVDTIVKLLTPQGKWVGLFYPGIRGSEAPNRSLIDSKGRIWIGCIFNTNGVFCIDANGTPENVADDQTRFRSSYTNQDGTSVGSGDNLRVFALAEDRDGSIWIGTAQGPLLVSNPSKWFDSDFRITQVKIPRNDGTNLADYLLAGERINSIAIDGGGRKWFATNSNGVYLMSADGQEEIHHFTTSNSPLLSDNVQSVAILPTTGEVFFGTDKGIISYQSDATEPEESFSSDIHAFPNPVHSGYTGLIAVKGLVYDTDVKIVDMAGAIVYEGRSNGGMFSWDGRNKEGKRVASGVYLVLAADSEGKEGVVTKIVMVR